MRLISTLLTILIAFYGAPVLANQEKESDPDDVMGPVEVMHLMHSGRTTAESRGGSDRSSAWPPGPLERLLVQESFDEMSEDGSSQSRLDAQIAELRRERAKISTGGPRAAVITGAVMTGVGAVVGLSAALVCAAANSDSGTKCNTSNAEIFYISGGALATVGLITLISGITKLNQRRAAQSELDQKIRKLQNERRSVGENFDAHLQLGERKMLSFSWTF